MLVQLLNLRIVRQGLYKICLLGVLQHFQLFSLLYMSASVLIQVFQDFLLQTICSFLLKATSCFPIKLQEMLIPLEFCLFVCLGFYAVSTVFQYLTATVHKCMCPGLFLTSS